MALFHFGKKKETKQTPSCCCSSQTAEDNTVTCCCPSTDSICCIKILGAGCKACHEQYDYAKKAVSNLGLNIEVEYITDMQKIMSYGVMSMPAIVVNEKVISAGKVLKTSDVEKLLKK